MSFKSFILLAAALFSSTAFSSTPPAPQFAVGGLQDIYTIDVDLTNPPSVAGQLTVGGDACWGVAISTDGKTAYEANRDGTVAIIDISNTADPRLLYSHSIGHGDCYTIAITPDESKVLVGNRDGTITIITSPQTTPTFNTFNVGAPGGCLSIAINPTNANQACVANNDGSLYVIDVSGSGEVIGSCDLKHGSVIDVVITPDGEKAYTANSDSSVSVVDISNPELPTSTSFSLGIDSNDSIAIDPRDPNIAYVGSSLPAGLTLYVVGITETSIIGSCFVGRAEYINGIAITPDGTIAALALYPGAVVTINVSDPTDPKLIGSRFISNNTFSIAFIPIPITPPAPTASGERIVIKAILQKTATNKITWQPTKDAVLYQVFADADLTDLLFQTTDTFEFLDPNASHNQYFVVYTNFEGKTSSPAIVTIGSSLQ